MCILVNDIFVVITASKVGAHVHDVNFGCVVRSREAQAVSQLLGVDSRRKGLLLLISGRSELEEVMRQMDQEALAEVAYASG